MLSGERAPRSKPALVARLDFCRASVALLVAPGLLLAAEHSGLTERALQPRSVAAGTTLFTTLSAEDTGVVAENRYVDPRMWAERYHEFGVGAIGTGVAVGDYDGDGAPDIFVVSKTESSRLFRNLGDWKFEDTTAKAGVEDRGSAAGEWKQGATFADVNNDGWLDLYVCRFDAPNLLYINQGNGTFVEEAAERGLALRSASGMGAFCDYDRDGWLDVYVQTNLLSSARNPRGERDRLFRNRGDGTFIDVTDAAGIGGETQGHSATWWDHDEDGWPDLYVANDFAAPDVLYRNNGDGTFTDVIARMVPHLPYSAMGADVGDIDNDGLLDFLVADMAATTLLKDQRGMAESRARGKEDHDNPEGTPQYLRNAVYLNSGAGLPFREAAYLTGLAATDWTWAPRFEDLDNDGRVDLFVTTGMNREQHNADLLVRMMTAETPSERVRLMRTSPVLNEANLAFRNQGDFGFESVGAEWGLDQKGVSFGAAFGDFDGDGDLDVVFTNFEAGPTLLRNDSAGGHRAIVELRGTVSNRFGAGATVRIETASGVQVRTLVLARGYLSSSEPVLHFGLGRDERIRRLTVTWPSGAVQTLAELAADRRYVIEEPRDSAKGSASSDARGVRLFSEVSDVAGFSVRVPGAVLDETVEQPLLPFRLNRRGPALAVGDLDGDAIDDVVLAGTTLARARVLRGGESDAAFAAIAEVPGDAQVNDGPVLIFDANGDGHNDVLVTKGGVSLPQGAPDYRPQLLLNDGDGGLQLIADALPNLSICVGAAAAADFNGDGRLDLFLGARVLPGFYPETPRSVLLENRGGRFVDATERYANGLSGVGLVTAAQWSDVDDDGWIDLLVATEWGGVRYWHNERGRRFEDRTEAAGFGETGAGWWTSLAAADFNRDGRLDYVVGNVGLNTPYQASEERPALMFYGEFHEEGGPQIIEAVYDEQRLAPRRSRRHLAVANPSILRRFLRTDAYARASLAELVGEERLEQAQRFAATELRSGVLLSSETGRFRFQPLPRIAQIAPLQGLAAGDFDGDGLADVYAVQNSHAPVYVTGHFDGGLSQLLRGDGGSGFVPVPPNESGLVVASDAEALAVIELNGDGWPDFLVSRNDATTMAFRNNGIRGRSFVTVRLRGASGNRDAIGARIVAEHADGSTQLREVHAGSGYYSQSSASCFFGQRSENPVRRIRVRWPSREITIHDVRQGETSLAISQP